MNAPGRESPASLRPEERFLDPANLEAERHQYSQLLVQLLEAGDWTELTRVAGELSPGDLSEVLRPLKVEDTARILRLLPADAVADVLTIQGFYREPAPGWIVKVQFPGIFQ